MNPIERRIANGRPLILDGGLSTQLERGGADLDHPLWTARALLNDPETVAAAHRAFLDAGADVLITASYQVSREGFVAHGSSADEAAAALRASVSIARRCTAAFAARAPIVAASVGPYGAILADGSEYRGRYALTHGELVAFHRRRIDLLLDARPDLLAIETIPSIAEARAIIEVLADHPEACAWLSFTCADAATLADGTPFAAGVALADATPGIVAVGANCTAPVHITALVHRARAITSKPIVVYPNAGGEWDPQEKRWREATDRSLAALAPEWRAAGASLIGGCCGTDADGIRALAGALGGHAELRDV